MSSEVLFSQSKTSKKSVGKSKWFDGSGLVIKEDFVWLKSGYQYYTNNYPYRVDTYLNVQNVFENKSFLNSTVGYVYYQDKVLFADMYYKDRKEKYTWKVSGMVSNRGEILPQYKVGGGVEYVPSASLAMIIGYDSYFDLFRSEARMWENNLNLIKYFNMPVTKICVAQITDNLTVNYPNSNLSTALQVALTYGNIDKYILTLTSSLGTTRYTNLVVYQGVEYNFFEQRLHFEYLINSEFILTSDFQFATTDYYDVWGVNLGLKYCFK